LDAEPEHREVALDAPPARRHHALDAPVPLERRHRVAEDHVDTVIAVEALDHAADLLAERAEERGLEWLDRAALAPALAERAADLGADEAETHDDRPAPRRDHLADAVGVGHRAQIVDAREVETGNAK